MKHEDDRKITAQALGIDSRYRVLGELGRGAASCVFAVRDRVEGGHRALKIAIRRAQVRLFQSEYSHLAELRHPNVVRVYDFGRARGGMPYYTMELVRGVTLGERPEHEDPEVLGSIAWQVLDALRAIHARGLVHRDVKPNNLLVVGAGPSTLVRLFDLGLMIEAGTVGKVAGTLPYLAPEVARGEVVDGRADLYSLGVLLYECLLPEDAARTVAEVSRRLSERPTPPHRINPGIPVGFSELIMRLIDPDPAQRFAGAAEAAEALTHIPALRIGSSPSRAAAERMLQGGAVAHRPRVARKIKGWVKKTPPDALVVSGARGVGKTPVLRELNMRLNLDGFRVVRITASEKPGTPLPALIKAARAVPSVTVTTPGVAGAAHEATRFARQLGRALGRALGDRPTVVLVDDIHCAEPVTLEILRHLGHLLASTDVRLVYAADERPGGIDLAEALGPVTQVQLLPLTKSETAGLVAHRLGGLTLPPVALERLVQDSQGMPSLVERTLARMLVDGTIVRSGTAFRFEGGRYRAARHDDPQRLEGRIARVPPELYKVLWAASVLRRDFLATHVAHVADLSELEAAHGLTQLAMSQILHAGKASLAPAYVFTSRSLSRTVYRRIPPETRSLYHDRAATLFADDDEARTEHSLRGSDPVRAVEAAITAGDRAAAVFADTQAIEYYTRAHSH